MKLHELCQAYQKGDRWVCFTGSFWATGKTERSSRHNANVTMDDELPAGNCWQLIREIAFRLTGSEPVDRRVFIQNLSELEDCTVEDLLIIAHAVEVVNRYSAQTQVIRHTVHPTIF